MVRKSKRKLSEGQLKALAEGRRKRWEKKRSKKSDVSVLAEETPSDVDSELITEEKKSEPNSSESDPSSSESEGSNSSASPDLHSTPSATSCDSASDINSDDDSGVDEKRKFTHPTHSLKPKLSKVTSKNEKAMKKMNKCIARQVAKQGKHSIKLFYSNLSSAAPCCFFSPPQSSFEDIQTR